MVWLIIKMKQFELQQVKFPKPQPQPQPNVHQPQLIQKSTAQSQMIRIIIALLIAIFIFNSSQETTINYNQIIKNQKMFLVKNIRGVIPTLSGNIFKLQDLWKVVHFENYQQNDSQIFANYTFFFNTTSLVVENKYCNTHLVYDWKNYSYNIDFSLLFDNTRPMTTINLDNHSSINDQNINQSNSRHLQDTFEAVAQSTTVSGQNTINNQSDPLSQISNNQKTTQAQANPQTLNPQMNNISNSVSYQTQGEGSRKLSQQQQKCQENIKYFKSVIVFTSVYTISSKNLYLLIENADIDQDFYMILKPISRL